MTSVTSVSMGLIVRAETVMPVATALAPRAPDDNHHHDEHDQHKADQGGNRNVQSRLSCHKQKRLAADVTPVQTPRGTFHIHEPVRLLGPSCLQEHEKGKECETHHLHHADRVQDAHELPPGSPRSARIIAQSAMGREHPLVNGVRP